MKGKITMGNDNINSKDDLTMEDIKDLMELSEEELKEVFKNTKDMTNIKDDLTVEDIKNIKDFYDEELKEAFKNAKDDM